eukprot:scaffold114871_cov47-Attheya_sp.AAC.1
MIDSLDGGSTGKVVQDAAGMKVKVSNDSSEMPSFDKDDVDVTGNPIIITLETKTEEQQDSVLLESAPEEENYNVARSTAVDVVPDAAEIPQGDWLVVEDEEGSKRNTKNRSNHGSRNPLTCLGQLVCLGNKQHPSQRQRRNNNTENMTNGEEQRHLMVPSKVHFMFGIISNVMSPDDEGEDDPQHRPYARMDDPKTARILNHYMKIMEQLLITKVLEDSKKSSVAYSSKFVRVSYDSKYPPYVRNMKADRRYQPPRKQTNHRRYLITAAVPVFVHNALIRDVKTVRNDVLETLRQAVKNGVFTNEAEVQNFEQDGVVKTA